MLAPSPSQHCDPLPEGLVSLWDMLELRANEFIGALYALHAIEILVDQNIGDPANLIGGDAIARASARLTELQNTCSEIGATITGDFVQDALANVHTEQMSWAQFAAAAKQIQAVLQKELARAKLFAMSPTKISFFTSSFDLFELDVWGSFGAAMDDVDEAGKCFAVGRHTACVFHLMRVLERPINALAKVLLPNDPTPNWGTVLKKIDCELAKNPNERVFKGDVQFFAEVAAEMRAVQHAWRNRVMHIDQIVTEERAKAIFDATVGFMNAVSKKLDENGLIDPNFALDLETPSPL